jgi:hypothetical protein
VEVEDEFSLGDHITAFLIHSAGGKIRFWGSGFDGEPFFFRCLQEQGAKTSALEGRIHGDQVHGCGLWIIHKKNEARQAVGLFRDEQAIAPLTIEKIPDPCGFDSVASPRGEAWINVKSGKSKGDTCDCFHTTTVIGLCHPDPRVNPPLLKRLFLIGH